MSSKCCSCSWHRLTGLIILAYSQLGGFLLLSGHWDASIIFSTQTETHLCCCWWCSLCTAQPPMHVQRTQAVGCSLLVGLFSEKTLQRWAAFHEHVWFILVCCTCGRAQDWQLTGQSCKASGPDAAALTLVWYIQTVKVAMLSFMAIMLQKLV